LTNIPLQRRTPLDAEAQPGPAPERNNESNSDGKVDLSPDRGTQTGPLVEGLDRATAPGIASTDEVQDWRTQVRESMNELEQPELIPKIIEMMEKYSVMWSCHLGEITATQHQITLKPESVPTRQPPYRAGHKSREIITEQVNKMRQAGVIEPAQSEWASPVVIVTKKDGNPRFCVDYRKLNTATIRRLVSYSEDGRLYRLPRESENLLDARLQ